MDQTRTEIMNGVWLTHLRSDKFKTACISLSLLCQLRREDAAMNALLPCVLRRGTSAYPDMEAIARRTDELYGAAVEPVVRRIGEIQSVGFFASLPEEEFLPAGSGVLEGTIELLGQLLLSPNTRGGLFLPDVVDSEREKLLEIIRGRVNDKLGYSIERCREEMCCCEDYAVSRFGDEESAEAIRYQKLTRHYRTLLNSSPIEIFYCGRADARRVERLLRDALSTLPRGEIDYDIGTDVRMNSLEERPREITEQLDVTQAKLVIGWRLGECMAEPDFAALRVFCSLFGGSTMSKLFVNVREKLGLCYFADAVCDVHKGVMFAFAGTEFENVSAARDEILAQLEAIARGDIGDEELAAARADVISSLQQTLDSPMDTEGFYLSAAVEGMDIAPEELCELVRGVTKLQLAEIARGCECDLIYTLTGSGEDSDETETEESAETETEDENGNTDQTL